MRRLVFLGVLIGAFVVWRGRTLDQFEREHHLGPYADVAPSG